MSSDAKRIPALYDRYAYDWDQVRSRSLTEKPWLDKFLSLLTPKAYILDIGCGGGEPIARYFIEREYKITGVDSSTAFIDICKNRFPNHEWIVADMRELSLGRQFEGILAWDSFFHLCPADQRGMFPIFRQHASPKASLMFTSGPRLGEAIGVYKGEALYHGSLDEEEYRSLLNENEFDVVSHVVEDPTCGYHTIWLSQLR